MTDQFEDEMREKMSDYIRSLEVAIFTGQPQTNDTMVSAASADQRGLADALPALCDELLIAYRERFYEQIVKREP